MLRRDKKKKKQKPWWEKKATGEMKGWWTNKRTIKPPGLISKTAEEVYGTRPAWQTFESPKPAWESLPKEQREELQKKLTTATAFKTLSEKDKKSLSKSLGLNKFVNISNPFGSINEVVTANILRAVESGLVPEPPGDRWVKMRSGPFVGQWKKVHEEVPLWKEALYRFVSSSMMSAVAYNPDRREMEIEFVGGAVYRYRNIPAHLWEGLINAPSKGKYFWRHIRRYVETYPYKRVRFMREETVPLPESLKEKGYKT